MAKTIKLIMGGWALALPALFLLASQVRADEGTCLEMGSECEPLMGTCCEGLECTAVVDTTAFSAVLSCQEPYDPPCNVCGSDPATGDMLEVGDPDADPMLPLPGFTFSCGDLELAGQLGVFDATLCSFVPSLISAVCECEPSMDMDGGNTTTAPVAAPTTMAPMPSMAPAPSMAPVTTAPEPTMMPSASFRSTFLVAASVVAVATASMSF